MRRAACSLACYSRWQPSHPPAITTTYSGKWSITVTVFRTVYTNSLRLDPLNESSDGSRQRMSTVSSSAGTTSALRSGSIARPMRPVVSMLRSACLAIVSTRAAEARTGPRSNSARRRSDRLDRSGTGQVNSDGIAPHKLMGDASMLHGFELLRRGRRLARQAESGRRTDQGITADLRHRKCASLSLLYGKDYNSAFASSTTRGGPSIGGARQPSPQPVAARVPPLGAARPVRLGAMPPIEPTRPRRPFH